jgi:hypothetical protein
LKAPIRLIRGGLNDREQDRAEGMTVSQAL